MNAYLAPLLTLAALCLAACAQEDAPTEQSSAEVSTPTLAGRWRTDAAPIVQLSLEGASYRLEICTDAACTGTPKESETGTWSARAAALTLAPESGAVTSIATREFVFLVFGPEKNDLILETNVPLVLPGEVSTVPREAFRFARVKVEEDAAPTPCGPALCAAGTTCCNPLSGACTGPGELCLF